MSYYLHLVADLHSLQYCRRRVSDVLDGKSLVFFTASAASTECGTYINFLRPLGQTAHQRERMPKHVHY